MKTFIGTCVNNPFGSMERLEAIVDEAEEISQAQFLQQCTVTSSVLAEMQCYPQDFEFYRNGEVYFFCWSAIEHFYR